MQDSAFEQDRPSLTLYVGDGVAVIVGSKTYRGTLVQDGDRWYVKLAGVEPGETDEVVIAKL